MPLKLRGGSKISSHVYVLAALLILVFILFVLCLTTVQFAANDSQYLVVGFLGALQFIILMTIFYYMFNSCSSDYT